MGRDDIKIIEFDQDDDGAPASRSTTDKGMKIVEFDKDRREEPKAVATARDIGHIKIVEFGDDEPTRRPAQPSAARPVVKPVKIKDFGAEAEDQPRSSGASPKIKIKAFD
jgi:hypothetical protein